MYSEVEITDNKSFFQSLAFSNGLLHVNSNGEIVYKYKGKWARGINLVRKNEIASILSGESDFVYYRCTDYKNEQHSNLISFGENANLGLLYYKKTDDYIPVLESVMEDGSIKYQLISTGQYDALYGKSAHFTVHIDDGSKNETMRTICSDKMYSTTGKTSLPFGAEFYGDYFIFGKKNGSQSSLYIIKTPKRNDKLIQLDNIGTFSRYYHDGDVFMMETRCNDKRKSTIFRIPDDGSDPTVFKVKDGVYAMISAEDPMHKNLIHAFIECNDNCQQKIDGQAYIVCDGKINEDPFVSHKLNSISIGNDCTISLGRENNGKHWTYRIEKSGKTFTTPSIKEIDPYNK